MKKPKSVIIFLVASIIALLQITPLITMALNSLRTGKEIESSMLGFPKTLHLENYIQTWINGKYLISYGNNIIIGFFTVLIVVTVISCAAYGITKLNVYFKGFFMAYFVVSMSIPAFGIIVPLYFMLQKVGLINSHLGIILIYSAIYIPFNFLLIRAFFVGVPKELEEAACIDGCSELTTLLNVTLPLAKPIILTVSLIVFVSTWNEFLFSNTFLQDDNLRTVALRFYNFAGKYSTEYEKVFAAACISIMPIIFIYFGLQKSFIEGMTQGSMKG